MPPQALNITLCQVYHLLVEASANICQAACQESAVDYLSSAPGRHRRRRRLGCLAVAHFRFRAVSLAGSAAEMEHGIESLFRRRMHVCV